MYYFQKKTSLGEIRAGRDAGSSHRNKHTRRKLTQVHHRDLIPSPQGLDASLPQHKHTIAARQELSLVGDEDPCGALMRERKGRYED